MMVNFTAEQNKHFLNNILEIISQILNVFFPTLMEWHPSEKDIPGSSATKKEIWAVVETSKSRECLSWSDSHSFN